MNSLPLSFINSPELFPFGNDLPDYLSLMEPIDQLYGAAPGTPLNLFLSSPRQAENAINSPILNFPLQDEVKIPEIISESPPPQIENAAVKRRRSERIELEMSQSVVYPAIHSFNNELEEEKKDEFISVWAIPRSHVNCHVLWADGSITKNELSEDIKDSAAYKRARIEQKNKGIKVKLPSNNWKEQGLDRVIGIYYWRARKVSNMLPLVTVECSFYSGAMCEVNLDQLDQTGWEVRAKAGQFNEVSFIPHGGSRGMRKISLKHICKTCKLFSKGPHVCATIM